MGTAAVLAAAALAGGLWIGLVGVMQQYRGVNETIRLLVDGVFGCWAVQAFGGGANARSRKFE